jgi:hypothetical protein
MSCFAFCWCMVLVLLLHGPSALLMRTVLQDVLSFGSKLDGASASSAGLNA